MIPANKHTAIAKIKIFFHDTAFSISCLLSIRINQRMPVSGFVIPGAGFCSDFDKLSYDTNSLSFLFDCCFFGCAVGSIDTFSVDCFIRTDFCVICFSFFQTFDFVRCCCFCFSYCLFTCKFLVCRVYNFIS